MTGYSIFNQNNVSSNSKVYTVSLELYEAWKKDYILDGLRGIRYGQSFCNKFGITNNLLYYTLGPTEADNYIKAHYIVG
jgi:hypothetical protein